MSEVAIQPGHPASSTTVGRKVGYLVAAAVNLVCLWLVNQLLGWGWPPFLTDAFEDLLPVVDLSLVASAVVNVVWVVRNPPWFEHLAQAGLDLIGLVVAVRTWQVFPFDLSSGWETVFRVGIVVGVVGASAATVVELVRFAGSVQDRRRVTGPGSRATT